METDDDIVEAYIRAHPPERVKVQMRGGVRPGAGRPPKTTADKASKRVDVRLTEAQMTKLDASRGSESRSAYLARLAGL